MSSDNHQPSPARNPAHPPQDAQGAQTITGNDYTRLWRAAYACRLLASITEQVAREHGIDPDDTAAIADYISEDMFIILSRAKPADE